MKPVLISTVDTAEMLGLSLSTVRRLIKDGEVEAVKIGDRLLITVESVETLIERSRVPRET